MTTATKREVIKNKLYNGQGGWLSNIGGALKNAFGSAVSSVSKIQNPLSTLLDPTVNSITSTLKNPDLMSNLKSKYIGSAKGQQLRQIIQQDNNFTPDVINNELNDVKIRAADSPEKQWSGVFDPVQSDNGGLNAHGAGQWLTGADPNTIQIQSSDSDPAYTGAHELLHKVWDDRVQNQPVGQAFQQKFVDAVKADPDATSFLMSTGLFGDNDLYGKPTTLDDAPPTEIYAYLGQNFARHPWDMPANIRPFYKGVLNFDATPERQNQVYGQDLGTEVAGMTKDLPYYQNLAQTSTDPQQKAQAADIVKIIQRQLPQVQADNTKWLMANSGVLKPEQKRPVIQRAISAVTSPLDNIASAIAGYFKNF